MRIKDVIIKKIGLFCIMLCGLFLFGSGANAETKANEDIKINNDVALEYPITMQNTMLDIEKPDTYIIKICFDGENENLLWEVPDLIKGRVSIYQNSPTMNVPSILVADISLNAKKRVSLVGEVQINAWMYCFYFHTLLDKKGQYLIAPMITSKDRQLDNFTLAIETRNLSK